MRALTFFLLLFLLPPFAPAQTPMVEVKDSGDVPLVQLNEDGGFVVLGGSGSIPAEGGGARMMWYPGKSAFRAGEVTGTDWDDANIGAHSVALGRNARASGAESTALGDNTTASGEHAVALGSGTSATGEASVAMGTNSSADGTHAVAMGAGTTADGFAATALGSNTVASGNTSAAMGVLAKALHDGAFVWADNNSIEFASTAADQFLVRASGGVGIGTNSPDREVTIFDRDDNGDAVLSLKASNGAAREMLIAVNQSSGGFISMETDNDLGFRTNGTNRLRITNDGKIGIATNGPSHPLQVGDVGDTTEGNGAHVTAGGTWVSTSSRTLKEGFQPVDAEAVLRAVAELEIQRWRYRGSDEGAHLGPMAEDFFAAFGLGADDRHIATVDADGVALAAIQGLHAQVAAQQAEITAQQSEIEILRARLARFEALLTTSDHSSND